VTGPRELHLVFDVGSGGTKAALLTPGGEIQVSGYRPHRTFHGQNGFVEQDQADWWSSLQAATLELGQPDRQLVSAVILTGQMQDVTLVDQAGEPLRPAILYSDTRARSEADEVIGRLGQAELRRLTGNDQGPGGLLAKLLWLKRNEAQSYRRAERLFLGAADYLAFLMTGEAVTDSTTASTTGLLDLATRAPLPATVLAKVGLERVARLLPRVQAGGELAGMLLQEQASALGLPAGIPVYLGPGDAGAANIGAGSGEIGPAYGYIGTSGWVAFSSAERADPDSGAITLAHPAPGRYIQVAPLLTAGGNLLWVRELFGSGNEFGELVDEALAAPPGPLLYLPYLAGERAPINDPLARAAFVGLEPGSGRANLYRAVLEGVAFGYRHALDALAPSGVDSLVLAGGGTRSPAWCGLFATILGVPVLVDEAAENVGVRGAQLAMRVATGYAADYDIRPKGRSFRSDARLRQHYDALFESYLALYPALRGVFGRLSDTPVPE
jgi:xylulokinase